MSERLMFTEHAQSRMAQRRLSVTDVEYVVDHGFRYYTAGVLHCFLGRHSIPFKDKSIKDFSRLEGTTVILEPNTKEVVITVYRNRTAFKNIRRKSKYNLKVSIATTYPLL